MSNKAVVLISGGMDSLVSAAMAVRQYESCFLHINYRQRTQERELKSFNDIANYYKVEERLIIEMELFKKIGSSSLTDKNIKVPQKLNIQGIPNTYVPFRNTNLLAVAVSWAETISAEKIFIGATEEDSAGYPDCRKSFYEVFNKLIFEGTKAKNIEVVTPLIDMKKVEIVKLGININVPFNLSWSCYQREDLACGKCDSCLRRLKAFKEAGVIDPIKYV